MRQRVGQVEDQGVLLLPALCRFQSQYLFSLKQAVVEDPRPVLGLP